MSLSQLHLSRLVLNPRSREARRDLANPYDLHRTLVRAFSPDEKIPAVRFLWRLESTTDWLRPQVLIQSQSQGNWNQLRDLPYYLQTEIEEKRLDPGQWLREGQIYRFRLQANPTVTRDGKRRGLSTEKEQLAWLSRQGERHGFVITQALVSRSVMQQGCKGDNRLSILAATFEGYLQTQDRDALLAAICKGIGPAKSLGCGLLSLGRT